MRCTATSRTTAANDGPMDTLPVSSISAPDLPFHWGQVRNDLLEGLRTIGFERRVTIAFVVTADAVLIEGVFYGHCQSNGRSSVCDIAYPNPSGYQAMSARHSPSAAERLCL